MDIVTRLNDIRAQPKPSTSAASSSSSSAPPDEPVVVETEENRVDTILNDVFQVRPPSSRQSQTRLL